MELARTPRGLPAALARRGKERPGPGVRRGGSPGDRGGAPLCMGPWILGLRALPEVEQDPLLGSNPDDTLGSQEPATAPGRGGRPLGSWGGCLGGRGGHPTGLMGGCLGLFPFLCIGLGLKRSLVRERAKGVGHAGPELLPEAMWGFCLKPSGFTALCEFLLTQSNFAGYIHPSVCSCPLMFILRLGVGPCTTLQGPLELLCTLIVCSASPGSPPPPPAPALATTSLCV